MKRYLVAFLMLLALALPARAADYSIADIYRGYGQPGYDLGHPQINSSGQIAFVGFEGEGFRIYFFDTPKITQLSSGGANGLPEINDRGQVLFRSANADGFTDNVYLYSNGTVSQVTDEAYNHGDLHINDLGEAVWCTYISDNGVYAYKDGTISKINSGMDMAAVVNNSGEIAWTGYDGNYWQVYLYSGGTTTQLTHSDYDNSRPQINDKGEVVWFGGSGSDSEIYLYKEGAVSQLTQNTYAIAPEINDRSQVVWFGSDGNNTQIYLYSDGEISQLTAGAYNNFGPQINDNGQVVWTGSDGQYNQIYIYDNGAVSQLTATSYDNYEPQINAAGQVVWYAFEGSQVVVREATPSVLNNYSRYDFTFNYNDGSGDYYTGYVYAPTAFQTSGPGLALGTCIYDQPMSFWGSGWGFANRSLNGGYYYITGITDGFASAYDKQSYITAYYDADTAGAALGVNSDGSATAGTVYVSDRTMTWESGYVISGSKHDTFSVYKEADVTLSPSAPPSPTASSPATLTSASSQAVWGAYWSQSPSLLEEEK